MMDIETAKSSELNANTDDAPVTAVAHKPRRPLWVPSATAWLAVDALLAYGAMRASFALSPSFTGLGSPAPVEHIDPQTGAVLFAFFTAVSAHIFGLHNPLLPRLRTLTFTRCVGATLLAVGFLALLVFAILYQRIGRLILFQVVSYTVLLMTLARVLIWMGSQQRRQRLLLFGAGEIGRSVLAQLQDCDLPFQVVAFADHDPSRAGSHVGNFTVLGRHAPLCRHCADLEVDELVTCAEKKLSSESLRQVMDCLDRGVRVHDFTHFVESNFFQVPVEHIEPEWFLHANLELGHPIYQALKRGVDLFSALFGLALSSPFLLLAAFAIKAESGGPVFYSQIRTGRLNAPFRIWKLRTMRVGAEANGVQWAAQKDPRVLFVGRIMRKTRLDEVPQFWNILMGDMSFVGPRPERPEFVQKLAKQVPFYPQRHLVKPGLTGWAQINYSYGASVEDALMKLKYDLYYIKHASLGLDFQIILRTIGTIMKGAR